MFENKYQLKTKSRRMLADTVTPVSIYLKLRDKFANSFLLESSDYHGNDNSYSYICCEPISSFQLKDRKVSVLYPDGVQQDQDIQSSGELTDLLYQYAQVFQTEEPKVDFIQNGLFGYMSYEAVEQFEDITLDDSKKKEYEIPTVHYSVFRYVIVLNHFKNELYVFEHYTKETDGSTIDAIINLIRSKNFASFDFKANSDTTSNFTDEEYLEIVKKGIHHCDIGDVFQIVLSRRFSVGFTGDEFQLYRALRSVNPSPYLFYFDYGSFKIFGSSPEAQIVVKGDTATIYPIAGTFRRTGDDEADAQLAKKLYADPKENSEHIMLVDLARNDLSKSSDSVIVETYKEIQYYSHVIHLVSKVTGQLKKDAIPLEMVGSTFPAGTLSGAPKHKAMQLIDQYETVQRGYYGGAIGFMGFNGDFNHAIMIRSFLSQNNRLFFQAGAGIVSKSDPKSEVQEVYNKLAALKKALEEAEQL